MYGGHQRWEAVSLAPVIFHERDDDLMHKVSNHDFSTGQTTQVKRMWLYSTVRVCCHELTKTLNQNGSREK